MEKKRKRSGVERRMKEVSALLLCRGVCLREGQGLGCGVLLVKTLQMLTRVLLGPFRK